MRLNRRRQMNLGRVRRAWINLRNTIAFAELLSLHTSQKALDDHVRRIESGEDSANSSRQSRLGAMVGIWHSLCAIDRFLSMILNLPAATKSVVIKQHDQVENVDALPRGYLWRLSELASRILDRDQNDDEGDAFAETFKIDQDLHVLARTRPAEWWNVLSSGRIDAVAAGSIIVQCWHLYLSLRTHLPFMLKAREDRRYQYNSTACLNACRDMLRRYAVLRMRLSSGFFILTRVFDFQTFTAGVVLLLNLYGCSRAAAEPSTSEGCASDKLLIENVQAEMRMAAREASGTIARQALSALEQLKRGLEDDNSPSTGMRLQIPFLGTLLVRHRRIYRGADVEGFTAETESQNGLQVPQPSLWEPTVSTAVQYQEPNIVDSTFTSLLESDAHTTPGGFGSLDAEWIGRSLFAEVPEDEEMYSCTFDRRF